MLAAASLRSATRTVLSHSPAAAAAAAAAMVGVNGTPQLRVLRRGYHENIIEHYENPRNVGSLDKNDDDVGTVSGNICILFGCFDGGMRDEATSPPFYMMTGACVNNPIIIITVFFVFNYNKSPALPSFFMLTVSDNNAKGLVGAPACGDVMKVNNFPANHCQW